MRATRELRRHPRHDGGTPSPTRSQGGFALVGVVMFILVLTILGLSLFSLTGYESQFMQHSLDGAEAFSAAAGGLDRARFALSRTGQLVKVKEGLPLDGVTYAVAMRGTDSTGTIDWDDPDAPDIVIRVKAQKNGESRFLEAKYDPGRARSLYKRLMSLSGVEPDSSGLVVVRQDPDDATLEWNYWGTWLNGEVRENEDNADLIFPIGYPNPPQPQTLNLSLGGVPSPDVDGFLGQHWISATNATPTHQNELAFDALSSPNKVRFFRTARTGGDWSLDVTLDHPKYNQWDPRIQVSGTAIWMLDGGLRSEGTVYVTGSGDPADMLVIVAKKGSDPGGPDNFHRSLTDAGIALLGSIDSTIPIVLVSDGGVRIENRDLRLLTDGDDKTPTTVNCLGIFAPYARIMGPDPDRGLTPDEYGIPVNTLRFTRSDLDPANALIDKLSDLGYLPNTAGALKGKLRFIAGTWREVTE